MFGFPVFREDTINAGGRFIVRGGGMRSRVDFRCSGKEVRISPDMVTVPCKSSRSFEARL